MILELLAGLVLFAIGQFRRHRYRRWNGYLVPVIFIILPASLFVLFVLNFAGNYSV